MKTKTREETLAELSARSAEGKGPPKKFNALLKRLIKIPPRPFPLVKKRQ
jgi:hypothetical protein